MISTIWRGREYRANNAPSNVIQLRLPKSPLPTHAEAVREKLREVNREIAKLEDLRMSLMIELELSGGSGG